MLHPDLYFRSSSGNFGGSGFSKNFTARGWAMFALRIQTGFWTFYMFCVTRAVYTICFKNVNTCRKKFYKFLETYRWLLLLILRFQALSQKCEKRLLVRQVCLSVRMKQLGSHSTDFMKFCIWRFFENLARKFKFH
jgi:hypothetical protein